MVVGGGIFKGLSGLVPRVPARIRAFLIRKPVNQRNSNWVLKAISAGLSGAHLPSLISSQSQRSSRRALALRAEKSSLPRGLHLKDGRNKEFILRHRRRGISTFSVGTTKHKTRQRANNEKKDLDKQRKPLALAEKCSIKKKQTREREKTHARWCYRQKVRAPASSSRLSSHLVNAARRPQGHRFLRSSSKGIRRSPSPIRRPFRS